jgi:hypothetical protein
MRNAYDILSRKTVRGETACEVKRRYEDYIKINSKEIGFWRFE